MNPEAIGWGLAIDELKNINVKKAKIFVDSEQESLKKLNEELPENFNFYYVSADRKPTSFNTIFSRLDKLIKSYL